MKYEELKTEYVMQSLGNGTKIIMCDFKTMRMIDCAEMTVGAIVANFGKSEVKFFKEVASE